MTAEETFDVAELLIKVKEPQLDECQRLKPDQALFTYLHLAADKPQAEALMASGATCIAYETVTEPQGGLPLLRPMSEVAGRISVHVGATYLHKAFGGRGVLLGGVPGVAPGKMVIIGGGVSGVNAAQMAVGLSADVTLFDINPHKLIEIDQMFHGRVKTAYSSKAALAEALKEADLVIGAVLIPGAAAPKLVSREQLKTMKPGAVLVDIAIDQGGCFETSQPTTHQDPIFIVDGIVHYCVANMPGAVARTSTLALNNATLPFIMKMAQMGVPAALAADPYLKAGLNVAAGRITYQAVAEALNLDFAA
jgi:alanine dehydrogenase